MPEAVEIDWIVLTGAEEHIQGELSPPQIEAETGGALFAPSVYYPLGQGGMLARPFEYGVLGDLDGDQDLDLATVWDGETTRAQRDKGEGQSGWLYAFNDGTGGFKEPHLERASPAPQSTSVDGADLNGDGRMDLMPAQGLALRILLNDAEEGWVESAAFEPAWLWWLSDAEEDGDVDLWLGEVVAGSRRVRLLLNDGAGHFDQEERKELERLGEQDVFLGFRLNESGEIVREHLPVPINQRLVRFVGDFDDDGDQDLLVSHQEWTAVVGRRTVGLRVFRGLTLLINQGDGEFDSVAWRLEADIPSGESVRWLDLNGDGLRDWVYVDAGERGTALVVSLGSRDDLLPVPEGRYPLAGQGGIILDGDLDGDGDTDLVVIEPASFETTGVHVLLNRLDEQITAIAGDSEPSLPADYRLGLNYPNPFNPQTVIPFVLPLETSPIRLRVFNLLGQPVRTLIDGPLPAGPHRVAWDGRDEGGQPVSAGVYLYRLQSGAWSATGRMVKVE